MARRMSPIIHDMASAYEARGAEILAVRYEDFTTSSEGFDATTEIPGRTFRMMETILENNSEEIGASNP